MGYNTTVVVYNDALNDIKKNGQEFAENMVKAIASLRMPRSSKDVPCGCHANAAMVVETHHADSSVALIVGGNCGQEIGYAGGWRLDMRKKEDRIQVLKNLAEVEGYTLRITSAQKAKDEAEAAAALVDTIEEDEAANEEN